MDRNIIKAGTLATLIVAAGFATSVTAQSTETPAPALDAQAAIAIALEQVPGEVAEFEREDEDGAMIYEIIVASTAGEMMELEIDGTTGEVIEIAAEDDKDCDKERDDDDDDDTEGEDA